MPARKRSKEPMPGLKSHGPAGYAKGCGCPVCSESNAKGQAAWKARQMGEDPEKVLADREARKRQEEAEERERQESKAPVPTYGEREGLIRRVIEGYGVLSAEAEVLASLAIAQARLIDRIQLEGKWHLQSVTVKTLRDCMKELKALVAEPAKPAGGGEEGGGDDFAASLRQPGES